MRYVLLAVGQKGVQLPDGVARDAVAAVAITSSTDATPIVVLSAAAHGLETGDLAYIAGHTTNTNANGVHQVTKVDATHFSLDGVAGNGAGAGAAGTLRNDVVMLTDAQFLQISPTALGDEVIDLGVAPEVGGDEVTNQGAAVTTTATAPVALTAAAPAALTAANPAAITAAAPTLSQAAITGGESPTEAEFNGLRTDLVAVVAEYNKTRTDVTAIRAEVVKLVTDIAAMRTPIAATVVDVVALRTRQATIITQLVALDTALSGPGKALAT